MYEFITFFLHLKFYIDNVLISYLIIKKQKTVELITKSIRDELQEIYNSRVHELNSLTDLTSVFHYGTYILPFINDSKSEAKLDLEKNRKRISELKQKSQRIKSINKYLNNSGKKHQRKKKSRNF